MRQANIARTLRGGKHGRKGIALHIAPAMLAAGLLMACSEPDGNRILGRWRAERFVAQGISMPMGPEFEVTPNAVRSPGGDVDVPISAITAKGNDVTLEGPMSLGLEFHFENANRISLDLPFVGKVYYRRVAQAAQVAGAPANPGVSAQRQSVPLAGDPLPSRLPVAPTVAFAPKAPASAAAAQTPDGMDDYRRAVVAMRQGDPDGAVRSLHASFQHGFRQFDLIDGSGELGALKSDPRYQALIARYR
ncbi:hypothetical protein ACKI2N_033320 [Cupriavidus sp. 30B13]|uniref:hypothetical protein n=1 Tax=Cupriavidus sp. 30B13 TaxID=3384241 RepID=UPI003B903257